MKNLKVILTLIMALTIPMSSVAKKTAEKFKSDRFTINFSNTPLTEALTLIASKGRMVLRLTGNVSGVVNYAIRNSTLEEALDTIATANNIHYQISGNLLTVSAKVTEQTQAGAPGQPATEVRRPSNFESGDSEVTYRSIQVMYASAKDLTPGLQRNLGQGESIVADDSNNALLVFSSLKTYEQVKNFVNLFDRRPSQILIEAQIVEATKSFARDLGISWGDLGAPTAKPPTVGILNPGPSSPNFIFGGLLGSIDGRALEVKLLAAESNGDAKIISRPKVFTLNNKKATIHSGITYSIKTLSAVTASDGSTSGGVTGGVTSITSGLELTVTPTVVGEGSVRMMVKVTNSEPDAGSAVDGIPGINDNSAETSVIIRSGQTATLAGLIKNSVSNNKTGVPFLSKIPGIGWLFSSTQKSDRGSELMIFLTPHIVNDGANVDPGKLPVPEVAPTAAPVPATEVPVAPPITEKTVTPPIAPVPAATTAPSQAEAPIAVPDKIGAPSEPVPPAKEATASQPSANEP